MSLSLAYKTNCTLPADDPLKIVFVSDAWHPQVNGVVRTLSMTATELENRGHIVTVLGPDRFLSVPLPTYSEIRLAITPGKRLEKTIEALDPTAIHIATEGPLGWAARHYCVKRGLSFTTSYHTRFPEYLAERFPAPLGLSYRLLRYFHRPSSAVMVATPTISDLLESHGFTNLKSWTRGVDTELFRPRDKDFLDLPRPIHLYVGRLAVEKNVEAFLSLDLPGTKLVVGEGPQRAYLEQKYPDVVFAGLQTGETLARYFAAADVFVFPSLTDTFGLVILEALAAGIPVAAFPVAGPKDILGLQDKAKPAGALSENLGEAITQALKIPTEQCRAFALQHSWSEAADQFLGNLQKLHL